MATVTRRQVTEVTAGSVCTRRRSESLHVLEAKGRSVVCALFGCRGAAKGRSVSEALVTLEENNALEDRLHSLKAHKAVIPLLLLHEKDDPR